MVAYSFKTIFAEPILVGLGALRMHRVAPKRQTVRAIGKKRHARPGEIVQLYTGLRTKSAKKLGEAVCTRTAPITIEFEDGSGRTNNFKAGLDIRVDGSLLTEDETYDFVVSDGFLTVERFVQFWEDNHGIDKPFDDGIIIYWEPK